MMDLFWTERYLNISSDRHLPMSEMIDGSTLAFKSALAPAARRQRAETSFSKKPMVGPKNLTAFLMVKVIIVGVIGFQRLLWNTDERSVVGVALVRRRANTIRTVVLTGQSS